MGYEGNQIDLLISILVRFPQIGSVHYEPDTKALRLVFLIRGTHRDFQPFGERFRLHLALFHQLRQVDVAVASLNRIANEPMTSIEVVRDVTSVCLAELNLIVELINDYYGDCVVYEGHEIVEEDKAEHNIIIESLLNSGPLRCLERLTGFRDSGRVLVYSTPLEVSET